MANFKWKWTRICKWIRPPQRTWLGGCANSYGHSTVENILHRYVVEDIFWKNNWHIKLNQNPQIYIQQYWNMKLKLRNLAWAPRPASNTLQLTVIWQTYICHSNQHSSGFVKRRSFTNGNKIFFRSKIKKMYLVLLVFCDCVNWSLLGVVSWPVHMLRVAIFWRGCIGGLLEALEVMHINGFSSAVCEYMPIICFWYI